MKHSRKVDIGRGCMVTQLGLGTAPLGGLFTSVTESQGDALVRTALASGIHYFDTAPHYGKGTSERRLGAALSGLPRSSFVISTKVGRLLVPSDGSVDPDFADADTSTMRVFDFSAQGVVQSLEESLVRLGLDSVEMVLIHDPDDFADQAISEAFPALAKLREQGIIKAIGVGMNQSAIPTRFVQETDIDFVLIAGRYTLLDQSATMDLLPAALARGVSIIAAGVFNSGVLANPVPGSHFNYAPASPAIIAKAQAMEILFEEFGVTLEQAAVQFPLQHPAVKSVLVGCRTELEVKANIAAFDTDIPQSAWNALDKFLTTNGGANG